MATLGEVAKAYSPPQTLNIADLEAVPISCELKYGSGEKINDAGEKESFEYNFIEVAGCEYRVPNSVLDQIKKIIQLRPDIQYVKVNKSGSGLGTRYNVDPIEENTVDTKQDE